MNGPPQGFAADSDPPYGDDSGPDGSTCDYRYDPMSRCDGIYVDAECDQCGRAPLLTGTRRRRVRMPLSRGGHMDVSLEPDATPETIAALRELGEAALTHVFKLKGENMPSTRCKFRCHSIIENTYGHVISLGAAYAPDDPESENGKFWTATPSGNIQMQINNPDGAAVFEQGKDYYVDFTPSE